MRFTMAHFLRAAPVVYEWNPLSRLIKCVLSDDAFGVERYPLNDRYNFDALRRLCELVSNSRAFAPSMRFAFGRLRDRLMMSDG